MFCGPYPHPCWKLISLGIIVLAVALVSALPCVADTLPAQPGWIADPATGCRVWSDDSQPGASVTWSGPCENGLAQGKGIAQWSNRRYEGEMRDGKMSGEGAEIVSSGGRYDGEFRDGARNGHGAYTYADGDRYEGEWRDGKAEGHGLKVYVSGNRYDGAFHEGHYNGHGVFIWADGDRYEGTFVNDAPNGHGVFTWRRGDRYEGDFRAGKRTGHGVAIFVNGARYDGQWRDGKPNGSGIYLIGSDRFSGNWTEGCFKDGSRRAFVAVTAASCH
jgi:hypothetical protein